MLLLLWIALLAASPCCLGAPQWIWRPSSALLGNQEFCVDHAEVNDVEEILLRCEDPLAKIEKISFAAYGLPVGGCELPHAGLCNAENMTAIVAAHCVGKSFCAFHGPLSSIFGNPCEGVRKRLIVVAKCSVGTGIAKPSLSDAPVNTFTYFRTEFNYSSGSSPSELYISIAADSNAAVFLNGALLSRKVTRYKEEDITSDRVYLPNRLLYNGTNTIAVRHFSWGNIETFQRTGEKQGGLCVTSNFGLESSASGWQCLQAPEYIVHPDQIVGVAGGAHRIRFPQLVDGRSVLPPSCFSHPYTGCPGEWQTPVVVTAGPWLSTPPPETETSLARRLQSGTLDWADTILAAGTLLPAQPLSPEPFSVAKGIGSAKYQKDAALTASLQSALDGGLPLVLSGGAGTSAFITVDFQVPKHGYPVVEFAAPTSSDVVVDFGYGEKAFDLYTGDAFVTVDGWLNPEGVVGTGYADRYTTTTDDQRVELPDERTARWMTLNIHFVQAGTVSIAHFGIQSWMFPTDATGPDGSIGITGSFECGDPIMDQIVQLSLTHAAISMSDTYVDCPGREDGQWMEDARPRALIAAAWFNDSSLRRIMIRHQAEMQTPDGSMHPFPPSNFPAGATVDWSVQWVATMYDDYMFTGDTSRISLYWTQLVRYWTHVLVDLRPDGMWTGPCLNDIRITPGCPAGTSPCSSGMVTPWVIERLQFSATMADAIGQSATAAQWRSAAQSMTNAFHKYHFVSSGRQYVSAVTGLNAQGQWIPSPTVMQAAQTVAVFTGLLNASQAAAVLDYAFPEPDGSPTGGVLRWNNPTYLRRSLKALSYANRTARAISHLKERFSQYLPQSPQNPTIPALQGRYGGPLPEYWISRVDEHLSPGQTDDAQPVDGTGSHGWTAVALLWMHTHLLGVTDAGSPSAPLLRIAPDDGGVSGRSVLPYVRGRTFTSRGMVSVDWEPSLGYLSAALPDSTKTTIVGPQSCKGALKVVSTPPGGKIVAQDPNAISVSGAGEWLLMC